MHMHMVVAEEFEVGYSVTHLQEGKATCCNIPIASNRNWKFNFLLKRATLEDRCAGTVHMYRESTPNNCMKHSANLPGV